jgi:hypothetical protein
VLSLAAWIYGRSGANSHEAESCDLSEEVRKRAVKPEIRGSLHITLRKEVSDAVRTSEAGKLVECLD